MKKHSVLKLYWNLAREEKWLNEMASRGYSLSDYWWIRYTFEETQKSEYAYAIQMLSSNPNSIEGKSYISFLEENNIECVATYLNWAYFRKKKSELSSTDGKLIIYSDYESQKAHAKRILFFYLPLILLNFSTGLLNIFNAINNYNNGRELVIFLFCISLLNILVSFALLTLIIPQLRYISALKKKHKINEG